MSQEKVDLYKENKLKKKSVLAQERKKYNRTKWIAGIICAIVLCWVLFSVYQVCIATLPREQITIDYSFIDSSLYYFFYY